jgi:WD40 repeat protein
MIQWKAHNGCVRALSYSPDGAILVSGAYDRSLGVWDPVSGARRANVRHESLSIADLAFSPDGRLLAFATGRWVAVVCDRASLLRDGPLTDAIVEQTGEAGVWSVAFSPDGRNLVTAGGVPGPGSQAILWDVTAFKRDRKPREPSPRMDALNFTDSLVTATYAPDGRAVALGGSLGTIVVWPDPIPRDHLRRRDEPFDRAAHDRHEQRSGVAEVTAGSGYTDAVARYVTSLAFAPDGRTIATVSWDGTLRFWDAREAFELSCLDAGVGLLWGLALAPDGMNAAVGSERGDIVIIDVDERC